MIYVSGTRSYGYVDRVPGLGHVITQFGHFAGRDRGVQLAAALVILALVGSFLKGMWWMICNGLVHAVTIGGLLFLLDQPGTALGGLPMLTVGANVALGLYGLTRFWDFAGRDRGVQLAAALGIDRISAEEMLANMQGK